MIDHWFDRFIISPCSNPELTLEEALTAYRALGFRRFEAFSSWVKSALDIESDPTQYREIGARCGFSFASFHLPPVTADFDSTLERAVRATRFAQAVGAKIVLFKADTLERFIAAGRVYLDRIEGMGITPVLQNHFGTAISTLDDFRRVIDGIHDPRRKTLLEVGHFHSAGVSWREGCELLGDSIALVHIKDQIGRQSVPFGTGEIDLPGLFDHLERVGYSGDYVVEMEVADRQHTLKYLADAVAYLQAHQPEVNHD